MSLIDKRTTATLVKLETLKTATENEFLKLQTSSHKKVVGIQTKLFQVDSDAQSLNVKVKQIASSVDSITEKLLDQL